MGAYLFLTHLVRNGDYVFPMLAIFYHCNLLHNQESEPTLTKIDFI